VLAYAPAGALAPLLGRALRLTQLTVAVWFGGTTRGAQSASTATSGTRPIPPLPPTLVLEGAAQPFLFEMVASHALQARPPSDPFIAGQSTTRTGGYDAGMETDRLPAFLNDIAFEPGRLALVGGRLVDPGTRDSDRSDAAADRPWTILIRDGRIEAVIGLDDGLPDDARVLDLSGLTVLPGLIDAHIHVSMLGDAGRGPAPAKGAEPIRRGVEAHLVGRTMRDLLRFGVTTIRDVGAHGDVLLDARQAVRYGAFDAPRMLLAVGSSRRPHPGPGSFRTCIARRMAPTTSAARSVSRSAPGRTS
jgi:hypothetical protein